MARKRYSSASARSRNRFGACVRRPPHAVGVGRRSSVPVDREEIREQLRQGLGPDQIARGDRETHHAVLEEEAHLAGELGAVEATPENVVLLRDERKLRWEAIAARLFGGVRRVGEVKALYDQLQGEGAARRSYTGRGRRFPGMTGSEGEQVEPSAVPVRESTQFGIARESSA